MPPWLRPARPDDEPFLWEMLYEASHAADDGVPAPGDLRVLPELALYVEGWGRPGDLGVVGGIEGAALGEPLGAAWVRLLTGPGAGYGHVDDAVPELAVGVAPETRGTGLGTALLAGLLAEARGRYPGISLSVRADNPARRLYERLGFAPVPGTDVPNRVGTTSITMLTRF